MSRETFVYDYTLGKLVTRAEYDARQAEAKRSDLPCPMIVSDAMAPVQSMLDGKFYDSKSAIRATYRQAGVVEVGNDSSRLKTRTKPRIDHKAIKATLERAEARFNRGERAA